jgi:hypothetical protein
MGVVFRHRLDPDNRPAPVPTIAWTSVTQLGDVPNWASQNRFSYDAVSGQIIAYVIQGTSSSIYATDKYAYRTSTRTWTRLGGTGSPAHSCASYPSSTVGGWNDGSASDVQPWPSDRHPDGQNAVDTSRNVEWQHSGLACNNASNDLWKYSLNADSTTNTWTEVTPANLPTVEIGGSLVYIPTHDVLLLHGANSGGTAQTWVYCPSASPTAAQLAAGCTVANTWVKTYDAGGTGLPPWPRNTNALFDTVTGKVYHFGWDGPGGTTADTTVYAYDIESKTWTNQAPANAPTNTAGTGVEWLISYLPSGTWAGQFLYHRTTHTNVSGSAADFAYNPVENTWTAVSATGTGPTKLSFVVFDPSQGTLVAHESGNALWHGVLA